MFDGGVFLSLPYVFASVAAAMGLFFAQTRLSLLAMLILLAVAALQQFGLGAGASGKARIAASVVSVYLPVIAGVFHHVRERNIATIHALMKLGILASAAIVFWTVPAVVGDDPGYAVPESLWGGVFRVPLFGWIVLVLGVVSLLARNPAESPLLGPLVAIALILAFLGLSYPSPRVDSDRASWVFTYFFSASGLTLVVAVIESAWRSAHIDELTELPLRRAMKRHLDGLHGRYAIALIDVDHFKKINDRFGHDTGDQVLRFVAARLGGSDAGRCYRYGGEEFVLVMEGAEKGEAMESMDELRRTIEQTPFHVRSSARPKRKPRKGRVPAGDREELIVTVSIGVALGNSDVPVTQTFEAADKALYKAKNSGRNRVEFAR